MKLDHSTVALTSRQCYFIQNITFSSSIGLFIISVDYCNGLPTGFPQNYTAEPYKTETSTVWILTFPMVPELICQQFAEKSIVQCEYTVLKTCLIMFLCYTNIIIIE